MTLCLYDLNGNLTNDGIRVYIWDEADRLIEVKDAMTSEVLVKNRYDGLSRRRERVQREDGVLVTNRYVYDGWLVVAVLDSENDVLEQYVHGMDLSGTRQGAGGIGGILQVVGDGVAYYHYDGNGNVTTITDHQGATISRLEYDPFGRVLITDGSSAPRHQFSSKEFDPATGLNYYGYRFYHPETGRWLNREPLGERASANLYGFAHNRPHVYYDILGLQAAGPNWPFNPFNGEPLPVPEPQGIPDCPCSIPLDDSGCPISGGGGPGWGDPNNEDNLHGNASWSMRSESVFLGSGQQCMYDAEGNLINQGPSAGTPDRVAPGSKIEDIAHGIADMIPYLIGHVLPGDPTDLDHWWNPPNQGSDAEGNPCPPNHGPAEEPCPRPNCD